MTLLGPIAAFGASVTWAYSTARYARASRDVGSVRINQARALIAFPTFTLAGLWLHGGDIFRGMTLETVTWLVTSILGSYVIGDGTFLTSARRVGVTTALSIASTYPLWAALYGVLVSGEPFGAGRMLGTCLCVVGVVWLVRLSSARGPSGVAAGRDTGGLLLAGLTSALWAMNSVCVKMGSTGFDPSQVNSLRFGVALVLLTLQTRLPANRELPSSPTGGWGKVVPALVVDAVFGSTMYVYGLSHSDLVVGAPLSSLAPLISVPVAIAVGEETWNVSRLAAVIATVGGVVLLVVSGGG